MGNCVPPYKNGVGTLSWCDCSCSDSGGGCFKPECYDTLNFNYNCGSENPCPERVIVIEVCNTNAIRDDNIEVILNGNSIGILDFTLNDYTGYFLIGDDSETILDKNESSISFCKITSSYFNKNLIKSGANEIKTKLIKSNGSGNAGSFNIRSYLKYNGKLICGCDIQKVSYGNPPQTLPFQYNSCCNNQSNQNPPCCGPKKIKLNINPNSCQSIEGDIYLGGTGAPVSTLIGGTTKAICLWKSSTLSFPVGDGTNGKINISLSFYDDKAWLTYIAGPMIGFGDNVYATINYAKSFMGFLVENTLTIGPENITSSSPFGIDQSPCIDYYNTTFTFDASSSNMTNIFKNKNIFLSFNYDDFNDINNKTLSITSTQSNCSVTFKIATTCCCLEYLSDGVIRAVGNGSVYVNSVEPESCCSSLRILINNQAVYSNGQYNTKIVEDGDYIIVSVLNDCDCKSTSTEPEGYNPPDCPANLWKKPYKVFKNTKSGKYKILFNNNFFNK